MQTDITHDLLNKGIKPSMQRLHIFDYLITHKTHPTVEMIFSDLSPHMPTLSKTTVYNTLKMLSENDLIQTITIEGDELRFDADMSEHAHFKCTACGGVFDLEAHVPMSEVHIPEGFKTKKVQLSIWGTCADCGGHS